MEKSVKNFRGEVPKYLPLLVVGPRVIVDVLELEEKVEKSVIILPEQKIHNLIGFDYPTKEKEKEIVMLFNNTENHPYQAIVIATGPESSGLKVGDIIYCGNGLFMNRDNIQYKGRIYPIIGVGTVLAVSGNVKLEEA